MQNIDYNMAVEMGIFQMLFEIISLFLYRIIGCCYSLEVPSIMKKSPDKQLV